VKEISGETREVDVKDVGGGVVLSLLVYEETFYGTMRCSGCHCCFLFRFRFWFLVRRLANRSSFPWSERLHWVHNFTHFISTIQLDAIFPIYAKVNHVISSLQVFWPKFCVQFLHTHACYKLNYSYFSSFYVPNYIQYRAQAMKFLPCYFLSCKSSIRLIRQIFLSSCIFISELTFRRCNMWKRNKPD